MLTFLAGGHVLLEDIPRVGKTTLAFVFSCAIELDFRRIQLTPNVPEPFLAIATENPLGSAGTQPLPESQLDRFMISLSLGYPDFDSELKLALKTGASSRPELAERVCKREDFLNMQRQIHEIYLKENIADYILRPVRETRKHRYLRKGASRRATVALVKISKAAAWLEGRSYALPHDAAEQFGYVVYHRAMLDPSAKAEGADIEQVVSEILEETEKPPMGVKTICRLKTTNSGRRLKDRKKFYI